MIPRLCVFAVVLAALADTAVPRAGAGPSGSREAPRWEKLDQRPGEGEQCLVCGLRIFDDEVVQIRYQGRTFHVALGMLGDFEADPQRHFARLQARTALFNENALRARPLASGWLWFAVYVLVGLVFAAVCGYVAISKALPPIPWFFAGLLGNVAGLAVLLVTPKGDASRLPGGIPAGLNKVPLTRPPVCCPSCGAANHPAAGACSRCRAALKPTAEAETARI